jgi:hypothetical protein
LPPLTDTGHAVQRFIDLYQDKGRILTWLR